MSSTSLLPPLNGGHLLFTQTSSFPSYHPSATPPYKWGWKRHQGGNVVSYTTNGRALQILANPNASSRKGGSNEVIMVDPLEAKRLAVKQMEEIKAKEKFKRKRKIEAINGAWAMIGLTVGLLVEAQTGKSIPNQLTGYWNLLGDLKIFPVQLANYWSATVDILTPYRVQVGEWLKK